jgi:hypothetical protein
VADVLAALVAALAEIIMGWWDIFRKYLRRWFTG